MAGAERKVGNRNTSLSEGIHVRTVAEEMEMVDIDNHFEGVCSKGD